MQLLCPGFFICALERALDCKAALHRLNHFYESIGFAGVLAESDGVLGFALGNAEPFHTEMLFYLREMCVGPTHQGRGLGGRLYQALERELSLKSVKRVYLATERAIPAARFYINNGFEHMEEMAFYAKSVGS